MSGENDDKKKLEIRLTNIENKLNEISNMFTSTNERASEEDIELFKRVARAANDVEGACINECDRCIRICDRCIRICDPCIAECSCGPCIAENFSRTKRRKDRFRDFESF